MSKINTSKQSTTNKSFSELPNGVTTTEENGRIYYVYGPTGFKTPHLNRIERHVAKQAQNLNTASSQPDPKTAVAKENS